MTSTKESVEIKLEVPWGHVAGKTWGSSEATRVLVLHGVLDNAGSFDRLIPLLPDNFYYVVLDLPGHGLSSPLPLSMTIDFFDYVFVVNVVLKTLKWKNCILMGHSLGAQLGIFYTFLYPKVITKIISFDGILGEPFRNEGVAINLRIEHKLAEAVINSKTPLLYTKEEIFFALKSRRRFTLNSAAAEALFTRATTKVGELYKLNSDYRLRNFLGAQFNIEYDEIMKGLKNPILMIIASSSWPERDSRMKDFEILLKQFGGNYTLRRVQGNHDVHNNNPEIVAPHVCAFLNDTGKSKI